MIRFLHGDCRTILPALAADSFDCVVTSPPYFGLRDYGVDSQIGLEPTLDAYVESLAGVFDELRRVLKPSGTCWLNLGDSYAGSWGGQGQKKASAGLHGEVWDESYPKQTRTGSLSKYPGLKPKDLIGVPWRVAFALQARDWWLRSAIVWAKPNPMPESVIDRPTSSYEMVFLLTKAERYFYDAEAIVERTNWPNGSWSRSKCYDGDKTGMLRSFYGDGRKWEGGETRNARNVWTIATQPYRGAHFATMPPDLAERCIKAGCPAGGHVLDPFAGAGTTGLAADRLQRHATLIDLNGDYQEMSLARIVDDAPLFAEIQV